MLTGHYYHIFNRGVDRQAIFFQQRNYGFFIQRMRDYFVPELVKVIAYCLMPNHYHLIVLCLTEQFGIKVMQPFGTSYVKAINEQQGRVGPLFQGRFKYKLIETDEYLRNATRYVHLNPVKAGYAKTPSEWAFYSYRDYIGLRKGFIPASDIILRNFDSPADYQAFVEAATFPGEEEFNRWLLS